MLAQSSLLRSRNCVCSSRVRHQQSWSRGHLKVQNLFTGIVQGTAKVVEVKTKPEFSQFRILFPLAKMEGIQIGASVAINGTCLTVTEIAETADGSALKFDVIAETLRATNLGRLSEGNLVNYERSARVGDEIGGHNVSGHVQTTARIVSVEESPDNRRLKYELTKGEWSKYILPKGFIAVDGTSLTVGEVEGTTFSVYLIPETLRVTVHGTKAVGDEVNVEVEAQTQAIVDTVERVMASYAQRGLLTPA